MKIRLKYYAIKGKKNRYIPIFYYVLAENVSSAKLKFYSSGGYEIDYILRITKKQYEKEQAK